MNKITINKDTVKDLDLKQYIGKWYEIARFDNSFEKGLQGVTAEYSFRKDGKIRVKNCGLKGGLDGEIKCTVGKARPRKSGGPGKLKVSFFLFFYSDYYVLELDANYQWVLIGSSSDKYLWILSRTPQLSADVLDRIIGMAKGRGYDTSKLIFVEQKEKR